MLNAEEVVLITVISYYLPGEECLSVDPASSTGKLMFFKDLTLYIAIITDSNKLTTMKTIDTIKVNNSLSQN